MTSEQHNTYLGYTFFVHGAIQSLAMLVMTSFLLLMGSRPGRPGEAPPEFFAFIVGFAVLVQLVFVLPSFIASFGLLRKRPWARSAGIAAGIMSVANVPVGTLTCVYALWYFLGEAWKPAYGQGQYLIERGLDGFDPNDVSRWSGYRVDEKGEIEFHTVEPPDWR